MALHTAAPANSRALVHHRVQPVSHQLLQQQTVCRARPPHATTSTAQQTAVQNQAQQPRQAPAAARKLQRQELLRDPAKIGSRGSATVMVQDIGGPVSLATYMQLPVEQYYILDPSQIQLLSGNTFVLSVPKINLLGASLQPVITVEVTSEQDAVVLQATDCQLNATGIMGGLDEKFAMQFTTRLTWKSPQHQHQQHFAPQALEEQQHQRELQLLAAEQEQLRTQKLKQQQQVASGAPPLDGQGSSKTGSSSGGGGSIRAGWDRLRQVSWPGSGGGNGNGSAARPSQTSMDAVRGSITGSAVVDVWCEVIPPFNLMPREVLVGTCNTVIAGLVNSLLPWFTRQLAADYQKWAQDASYRAARAARSAPRQLQQEELNN